MLVAIEIWSQIICCYALAMTYRVCAQLQSANIASRPCSYRNPVLPNNFMLSPVPPF